DSPVVQQLLADDRIQLSGYPRADALIALYPFLNKVVVPRGATNFPKDQPPTDVVLIATKPAWWCARTCIPRFSTCCSTPRWKSTRDRAFFAMPTSFPPPKLSAYH